MVQPYYKFLTLQITIFSFGTQVCDVLAKKSGIQRFFTIGCNACRSLKVPGKNISPGTTQINTKISKFATTFKSI